jgi:cytidine deaminase
LKLEKSTINKMIDIAKKTAKNAFVPFNKHKYGSCVLAFDGTMYGGCNVENSISGLGSCSEKVAIDNAVSNGRYKFEALCLYDTKEQFSYPCGACRQYIAQFKQVGGKDIKLILASPLGYKILNFKDLFPNGHYDRSSLNEISKYST